MILEAQKAQIKRIMADHKGKDHPISRVDLVARVQFDEPVKDKDRVVREILGELREEGTAIVNFGSGYFIAVTESELDSAIDRAESYLISFSKDIQALKEAKSKLFGEQKNLWEVGKKNLTRIRDRFYAEELTPF